jgi:hypothetical protein
MALVAMVERREEEELRRSKICRSAKEEARSANAWRRASEVVEPINFWTSESPTETDRVSRRLSVWRTKREPPS